MTYPTCVHITSRFPIGLLPKILLTICCWIGSAKYRPLTPPRNPLAAICGLLLNLKVSDKCVRIFFHFLVCCHLPVTWPLSLGYSLALLPKSTGGFRTIAKTLMFYRYWCALRRPIVKRWEQDTRAPWDVSFTGTSALDVALARSYQTEVGYFVGS